MKIKGVTLLEVLLTLGLTSLLVLITGNVYLYFQKIQIREMKKIAEGYQLTAFDIWMQKDFYFTSFLQVNEDQVILADQKKNTLAEYIFKPEYVIRTGFPQDTFWIQAKPEWRDTTHILAVSVNPQAIVLTYQVLPTSSVLNETVKN